MPEEQRPIGWWVKRLDALLEEAVDAAVAGEGLTRRHWQVLHSLAEGEAREAAVSDALRDFAGDVPGVVADLAARGWVARPAPGQVRLTEDGAAGHDRVLRAVGRVRRHAADGMSRQEYERTILVLARMVENMERALGRG
ncbi:MarR family winged helix-turn-helix transcriptional regulator [Blastococcus sp. TF02A-30]|uniref:MarR family winged helix-turn-helix transcriptional regulator n=1 Tax=Blastococcus sp. TF02A-30 TaxID=2250580 RepID=UPI000DEB9481|nr:MarR family transcriptional regulator [Blastococcus sp. TF02A-30]RBY84949.1 MarR family transcriptional regulator [Blastococcus sp. TF02A-30]